MFGNQPSRLQEQILTVYDRNPDMTASQIAQRCDCSTSYVNETLREFRSGPF